MSGCGCAGEGTPEHPCNCPDPGLIGDTSFGMRRFKSAREGTQGWTGFRRPVQADALNRSYDLVRVQPPVAGRHVARTAPTEDGGSVSMLGEPTATGAMFPQVCNSGYFAAAGRP